MYQECGIRHFFHCLLQHRFHDIVVMGITQMDKGE
jgi:hypothetical protein